MKPKTKQVLLPKPAITCTKSTMETPDQCLKSVQVMTKTPERRHDVITLNRFYISSFTSVSIVKFEHAFVCWHSTRNLASDT